MKDNILPRICNFNPRSREGSDYIMIYNQDTNKHFNPRSREGSDENPCY